MNTYILVYDIITSAVKTSLFSTDGHLVNVITFPLTMYFNGSYAEQSANQWWDMVVKSTKLITEGIDAKQILAISFTDQVQVCLCIDREGNPLRNAITWSDTRSLEVADYISHHYSQIEYMKITGQRNTPNSSIRKLLWVKEKEPKIYSETYKMLSCKDYIAYKLTGEIYTDYSDASSTGVYDINNYQWCNNILSALEISIDKLPTAVASTTIIGHVTEDVAKETGLSLKTPVVIGSGDFTCSAVGAGCVKKGDTYLNLGSSSWIATTNDKPIIDENMAIINNVHAVKGMYLPLGNVQEVGVVFKWLRCNILGFGNNPNAIVEPFKNIYPYENMAEFLTNSQAGADGLSYIPYMLGASSAYYDNDLKGMFIGLSSTTSKENIIRATLEGGTMLFNKFMELFRKENKINYLLATGIASHEEEWLTIISDALNVTIENTNITTTVDAIGAAIIAGVGIGIYDDLDKSDLFRQKNKIFYPNIGNKDIYEKLYHILLCSEKFIKEVHI